MNEVERKHWIAWANREGMKDPDDLPHERDAMQHLFTENAALEARCARAEAEGALLREALQEVLIHEPDVGGLDEAIEGQREGGADAER